MPLYTIIADYGGGTYVAQHRASSTRAALARWVQESESAKHVHRNRKAAQAALRRELTDPDNLPVPVAGLLRVLCTSASIRSRLLLLHIVETNETPNQPAAPNPAGASRLHSGHHLRRVGEPGRWAESAPECIQPWKICG
jgi:hypothetical protein